MHELTYKFRPTATKSMKSMSGDVTPSVPPTARARTNHVERYVVGGVTVCVRQSHRHGDGDVIRLQQRRNYDNDCEPVLDEYLRAAMATRDVNRRSATAKVYRQLHAASFPSPFFFLTFFHRLFFFCFISSLAYELDFGCG